MKILQIEVEITESRQLMVQLPEDIELGKHQIVLVIQPQEKPRTSPHPLNDLAGRIHSFAEVDAVQWQHHIRDEWND